MSLSPLRERSARQSPYGRGLPRYVERELEEYLRCGQLEHGFARVVCHTCRQEPLVACSCKRRGLCPSCTARRMFDTAPHPVGAHLYFTDWIGMQLELRDYIVKANPGGGDVNGDRKLTDADEGVQNNIFFTAGLTFVLPPKARITK